MTQKFLVTPLPASNDRQCVDQIQSRVKRVLATSVTCKKWRCLNSKLMYSRERKKWLSMTEFTPCIDTTVIVQTKARESWKEKQYIVDFFVHSFGRCQRIFFIVALFGTVQVG